MAHRLDILIKARGFTNESVAELVDCTVNYVSGIRNGLRPGLELATRICQLFPGELTLRDLGFEIDPAMAAPSGADDRKAG